MHVCRQPDVVLSPSRPAWGVRRSLSLLLALILTTLLAGCGGGPGSIRVSIASVSSQPRLQPGNTAQISITPLVNSFKGSITLSATTVTFTDASGNAASAVPSAQTVTGQNTVLTFTVPAINISASAAYQVSVKGSTSQDQTFSSLEPAVSIVYPAATITTISPASSFQSRSVTVAITGINTDFAQGQTQAAFGPGIAVNGAASGLPGLITVNSASTATASLVIDPAASIGAHDVVLTTQGQTATLKSGFTVQAALLPLIASAGGPYAAFTGRSVQFDGSKSSDPNGLALTYAWNFGDGSTGTGPQPTHTYAKPGVFTVQLTVSDSAGLTATASTTATLTTLANPTAVAGGPYTGTTGKTISFDASASTDPNGSTLTYAWAFGDGATGSGTRVTHAYASAGTYTATLTVTDTYSLTASAPATVSVTDAALPPVAQAGGPYTGTAGVALTFNGTLSTDPQGQTLTYTWDFGDGTTGSGARPTHTYANAGSYTVKLTVTNTSSLSSSAIATVTITSAPRAPTAAPGGPYTGTVGSAISFNGSASTDPQNQTLTYAWAFGDGTNGTGATPTHTYASAGTYTATLTVTDTASLSASATATVTITAAPKAPTAVPGGPYSGTVGAAISFNGSASTDPQNQTLTYAWTFGDGTSGTGATPTHVYTTPAAYTATLTVTDTSNLSGSATAIVTITAAPGVPTAIPGGPYSGTVGAAISFNGSASTDPQNQTLTYAWAFGDGTTGSGATPVHAYTTAGTFTATLTVTDTSNLSASATTTATITAAGVLTANAGGPYTGNVGATIQFNGSGSSDPNRKTLSYAWDFGDGNTATGVSPTHAYTDAQTYTVALIVTNTDGAAASATTTATVSDILQAIVGGPRNGNAGQSLTFDGVSSTAPSSDMLTYAWTFGDGGAASGAQVNHTYASSGTFNIVLTVTDAVTSLTSSAAITVTITAPPQITFTSPAQGALFNTTTVQVSGTAPANVQSVTVNSVTAALSAGTFTATVPVRAGVNILTAAGTDANGNVGTASTSVTIDLSPPTVSVLSPADGSTVTTQQIAVAGMVTDQVTGTINGNNVTVTVNGQPASVSNRSFLFSNLLLVPGANTVTLVAKDAAGNSSQSTVKVNFANPGAQQHIVVLSGDGQSGTINSVLPQPLVVQLVSPSGAPVPNRSVTFTVTASDGVVESLPQQAQTLNLTTDAQGKASVLLQLGSRAGVGINQVSVTSPGFMGSAVFTETTTAGPAAFIHEFLGNNQRGIIGKSLAQAFQVVVQDAGGDPIAGVSVTYTVNSGDGLFAGQTVTTVTTNSDGRASALLTLGQQEGINNNTVTADFPSDPNAPVQFYASGFSSGDATRTSVSGVVLDNAQNPVPNATASLLNTGLMTTTDASGHFVLNGVPVGTVTLLVDGSTTSLSETLPSLSFILQALPGQNNTLNMPVYLPIIDTASARTAGGSVPATLTLASLPGVALTIAPNSVTFPDGSHVGQLTLSQVKSDLVPMPPPNGIMAGFAWTIQPAGTVFTTPVTITIPNTNGLAPGQVQEFYQYDHDLEQFVSVGTLRVSPDGSVLNSDPGFGVTKAGWASPGSMPPPGGCTNSCNDNNVCTDDSRNKDCSCNHKKKSGGGCNTSSSPGPNSCFQPGMCVNGVCSGKPKPPGSGCDDRQFCTSPDVCTGDGICRGVARPPHQIPFAGVAIQGQLQGLTNAIQVLVDDAFPKLGLTFSATVGASGASMSVCCETKKNFEDNTNATYTAQGGLMTRDIFLPNLSFPFGLTGGGIGVSASFGLTLQGQISLNDTKCDDYKCAQGSFSVGGGVTINGGGKAVDPVNGTTVAQFQFQAPLYFQVQIQNSGDCKSIDATYGIPPVAVVLVEQLPFGPPVTIPIGTIFGGITLGGQSFQLQ